MSFLPGHLASMMLQNSRSPMPKTEFMMLQSLMFHAEIPKWKGVRKKVSSKVDRGVLGHQLPVENVFQACKGMGYTLVNRLAKNLMDYKGKPMMVFLNL